MGLSIHFSGSFNPDASLTGMIEEVEDIARVYRWPYHIYDTGFDTKNFDNISFNDNIYGISFTPPECETVFLCFLSNGKMSTPVNLHLYGSLTGEKDEEYLYNVFVKTQFAGYEIHITIILLLKYLEKIYFKNFKVLDEGEYWQTGNKGLLIDNFKRYTTLLNSITASLEINDRKQGESIEEYFKRIVLQIDDKRKEDTAGSQPNAQNLLEDC